jgi:hypothetical protein
LFFPENLAWSTSMPPWSWFSPDVITLFQANGGRFHAVTVNEWVFSARHCNGAALLQQLPYGYTQAHCACNRHPTSDRGIIQLKPIDCGV